MGLIKRLWSFLTDSEHRRRALLILLGAVLASAFFVTGLYAWEYTSTPVFCGTTCHTMPPEYNAYQQSAHAHVDCVTCHISKGVNTAIAQKVTDVRHVILYTFQAYETPIRIRSLRPAQESCENCHWPDKFYADRIDKIRHFSSDQANSETDTYLIMKTGGGTARDDGTFGIHWHIMNDVEFVASDDLNQQIPWVKVTFQDGTTQEYFDDSSAVSKAQVAAMPKHRMDCVDCHGRASHNIKPPSDLLDDALATGRLDKSLPDIKKKSLEAMSQPTETRGRAIAALEDYYRTNYPQVYSQKTKSVQAAVALVKQLDAETNFPPLQESWQTYPNDIGHKYFPGCFRCHDGKHLAQGPNVAPEHSSIPLHCNACHSIPETVAAGQQPQFTAIVPKTQPAFHNRSDWMAVHFKQVDSTCSACHGDIKYDPAPKINNQSFCANISCHGAGWGKYIKLIEIQTPGTPPLPTPVPAASATPATKPAAPTPTVRREGGEEGPPNLPADHAGRTAIMCLVCHGPAGVKPAPADHVGRTAEMCLTCHKQGGGTGSAPAATPQATATRPLTTTTVATTATATQSAATSQTPAPPAATAPTKPAVTPTAQAAAGSPPPLRPDHAGRTADMCLVCHGPSGLKPLPASHAGRTAEMCLICHKPA
jgi:nitrate/TMAO reductase-like tetraheme cytochrome c subunit